MSLFLYGQFHNIAVDIFTQNGMKFLQGIFCHVCFRFLKELGRKTATRSRGMICCWYQGEMYMTGKVV